MSREKIARRQKDISRVLREKQKTFFAPIKKNGKDKDPSRMIKK